MCVCVCNGSTRGMNEESTGRGVTTVDVAVGRRQAQ